jgi:hypothetical protein
MKPQIASIGFTAVAILMLASASWAYTPHEPSTPGRLPANVVPSSLSCDHIRDDFRRAADRIRATVGAFVRTVVTVCKVIIHAVQTILVSLGKLIIRCVLNLLVFLGQMLLTAVFGG